MATLELVRLTKHFNNLSAGEVAGFSAETAKHIIANNGGKLIGTIDTSSQVHRVVDGVDVIVDAAKDSAGNLVPKAVKKEEPKKDESKKDAPPPK